MATHSTILAWRIPMDRGAWRAIVYGVSKSDMTVQLSISAYLKLLIFLLTIWIPSCIYMQILILYIFYFTRARVFQIFLTQPTVRNEFYNATQYTNLI